MFRKAEKRQAKLRLALCGPSGSGKTYSALLIAQGLAPGGKIALIDTERGSGELYADLTAYDVAPLEPPYTPGRYIEIIKAAESAGYDVLIIDSLSHAWTGDGGVLDMHDKATAASRSGNSFAAWREVTPKHNALVDTIIGVGLHVVVTMRTKTAYDMVDDGKGGKKPIKIGLSPIQRDGMEYEFTTVVDLSVDNHIATATKDRTRLFDGEHFVPTAATGAALRDWLTAGKDPVAESKRTLKALKASATRIASVPELETWWRSHSAEIGLLTPPDRETLTGHCAARKLAILESSAKASAAEASKEPEEAPKRRGNGEDRHAAGIDALKAATL
ncbi:AAA ATPase [Thiocapsa sp. KS1]|nr:ATP-binding protein [Thiocapsa sp. KS1]CRI66888.1 AAA ATPase [Thiocapsa sp. KS1]